MKIIRAGVDSLYMALFGTLPAAAVAEIEACKKQAAMERRPVRFSSVSGCPIMISGHGTTGGYAFTWDDGPLGALWSCRQTADKPDWNFFAKPHAASFLALGFGKVCDDLLLHVARMGGRLTDHRINRIDYAIDIRADDFELQLENFVAHPHSKRIPFWQERDVLGSSAVFTGRRLESVTIGRMPGHQVIVYDKTAEVRARQKMHFFEAWKLDPALSGAKIWRIELRLGKKEVYNRRGIRTLSDLAMHLRPALIDLLTRVRYVASEQASTNISRYRVHRCWELAQAHVQEADLLTGLGEVAPNRLLEISKNMQIDRYTKLISGISAGLGGVMGLDDNTIEGSLPDIVADAVSTAISTRSFRRALKRARERQHCDPQSVVI